MADTPPARPLQTTPARAAPRGPIVGALRLQYAFGILDVSGRVLLIGRAADCDLVLDDSLVSRHHAKIIVSPASCIVWDLGSTNGVHVNDVPVQGQQRLEHGDVLRIGGVELTATQGIMEAPKVTTAPGTSSGSMPVARIAPVRRSSVDHTTARYDALSRLRDASDRLIARGRAVEAQTLVEAYFRELHEQATRRLPIEPEVFDLASHVALALALRLRSRRWLDWVLEMHIALGRVPSASLLADLELVFAVLPPDTALFRHLVQIAVAQNPESEASQLLTAVLGSVSVRTP